MNKMKLLDNLFASDTNFKPIKFKSIGQLRKIDDNKYKFYKDKMIVGSINNDLFGGCRCMINDVGLFIGEYIKFNIVTIFTKNKSEKKQFNPGKIDIEKIVDLVSNGSTEWKEIKEILNLVEVEPRDIKVTIKRYEKIDNYILLYDNENNLGEILINEDLSYEIQLWNLTLSLELSESGTSFSLMRINNNTTTTEYDHYLHHEITEDKLIKLALSNNFSRENIELMLNLK